MARKTQKVSLIPLVAGVFLLLLVFGSGGSGREVRPSDDGDQSNFRLQFDSREEYAVEDEPYWVRVVVENEDNDDGTMWVQCSILDMDQHISWLIDIGLQASVTHGTTTRDNCVSGESFTQTALIELEGRERTLVRFSMIVPPNSADNDMQIFCDAFEECYSDNEESGSTSSFRKPMIVMEDYPDDVDPARDEEDLVPQGCDRDRDCSGYLFGGSECYLGHCLDAEDVPSFCGDGECSGTENSITCGEDCGAGDIRVMDWLKRNKIITVFTAFGLILIGAFGITPKKKDLFS